MTILYILAAIFIFGFLIAIHEFGHFFTAKLCGVQVNEFSIGMGPCLIERQKGETQYSLRLLPIGGYCAMEGEIEASNNPRALSNQGFWKRLLIFAAGALMNLLTGFVIILLLYSGAERFTTNEIVGFAPEFPQEETGLQEGDKLYAINGRRVYLLSSDLDMLASLDADGIVNLTVLRDGKKVVLMDVPFQKITYTSTDGGQYRGYGLYIGVEDATLPAKLRVSYLNTVDFARIVWLSLGMLVRGEASMNDVSGPVGIVETITEVGNDSANIREALENILYLGALIAVNLAVMNLLPIPALDGGHIFFLVLDTIAFHLFKRKIPEKYENALSTVCFVLLMGFMLVVTFHDVFKLFQ